MIPKVYPITDTQISQRTHAEQVELFAAGGATLVQLRDKHAALRAFYEAAQQAMLIARSLGVRIIINDRVDLALAVGADGVHLGQDDLPPEQARALLGTEKIIGYSTHNLKQAMEADLLPVDYLAIGPVFATSTKENPDAVVGLAGVREVKERINKPLVAIGGITLDHAASVMAAGANSIAIISDLLSAPRPSERLHAWLRQLT